MYIVFGIVFFLSLLLLPVVLIKPSLIHATRKRALLLIGGTAMVFLTLGTITAPSEKTPATNEPDVAGTNTSEPSPAPTATPSPPPTSTPTPITEPISPTRSPTTQPTSKPTYVPTGASSSNQTTQSNTQTQQTAPAPNTGGGYTCDCSKSCSKISSCTEAQYQLNTCGCSARDGDKDGIACDGAPLNCQ